MILVDIIKAKEKSVMTKKELINWAIKANIGYVILIVLMWLFTSSIIRNMEGQTILGEGFMFTINALLSVFVFTVPNYIFLRNWKHWHSKFPKVLHTNPKTREIKGYEHYEKSLDLVAYIIAMDETFENRLNLNDENTYEYLMHIIDTYHRRKYLESINAPFEIDPN